MAALAPNSLVTLIGGSGFVGRHTVRALAKLGFRVRVAVRRPDLAGHTQPLGFPGQIMPVQANARYPASLIPACDGADAVVYLPGVLASGGAQSFQAVHVFGAEAAARAARAAGAGCFIHMSSLGADVASTSEYQTSKAEGEVLVRQAFPGAVSLRPSLIFGPEDGFFNRFAALARMAPALPLFGGGATKFQPVFVGDVADAIATLVGRGEVSGKTYELGGPAVFTFKQLLEFVLATTARKRLLVPLPWAAGKMLAAMTFFLPKPPITADQLESLKTDNVVSEAARREGRTLEALGIEPRNIEAIVPTYLYRYRKAGQFTAPSGTPE